MDFLWTWCGYRKYALQPLACMEGNCKLFTNVFRHPCTGLSNILPENLACFQTTLTSLIYGSYFYYVHGVACTTTTTTICLFDLLFMVWFSVQILRLKGEGFSFLLYSYIIRQFQVFARNSFAFGCQIFSQPFFKHIILTDKSYHTVVILMLFGYSFRLC